MLDVVATTPSNPLGACKLVLLDMAPRWRCGWNLRCSCAKCNRRATFFYTPKRRRFPSARAECFPLVECVVCPLPTGGRGILRRNSHELPEKFMKTRLLIFGLGLILTLTLAAPLARAD